MPTKQCGHGYIPPESAARLPGDQDDDQSRVIAWSCTRDAVATAALGPNCQVSAIHSLPVNLPVHLMLHPVPNVREILGIILMIAIKDAPSDYSTDGEPVAIY